MQAESEFMKEKILYIKTEYKKSPAWCWLLATVFLFPLLPEYISPFILFIGFIVFKVQWSKEGRKAKVGTLGKLMMIFMALAIISTLWSPTKFSTFSTAALWWGMFLIEIMIYNLARNRERVDTLLHAIALSSAINGLIGFIQIVTYELAKFKIIPKSSVLVTPLYKNFDEKIYTLLPFDIRTNTFSSRASGFFSNPNLLATCAVVSFPISLYLFLNAKTKAGKIYFFILNVLISCGLASTLTRAGCYIVLIGWLFMFFVLLKRHYKEMIFVFIPTATLLVTSILTRYGVLFKGSAKAAKKSSAAHFDIWKSIIDYLLNDIKAFIGGTGFGCEQTGIILKSIYDLDKPHAHNFVIEIWAELGVIGVGILFFIIFWTCGKLLEINANNGRKFTLVFCVFTSFLMFFGFGLTDFIFNSPKQIIYLFILLGLTQSISYCYDKTVIKDAKSLEKAAKREIKNTIHQ